MRKNFLLEPKKKIVKLDFFELPLEFRKAQIL